MKRNILNGILLISALALGSCSTTKLASNQLNKDDDVYFSKATAGDAPIYVENTQNNVPAQTRYNNYNDDDYYYYNSYASRINRFGYFSPFSYYDDIYAGYNSYYGSYSPYYSGFGIGFGFGGYYGYSPFNYGYGYSPFGYGYGYGYSPYSYFGTGYGYGGGGGFWGGYSAYGNGTPRPYRGSGAPTNAMVNRSTPSIGYNGNYPVNVNYPGRPAAINTGGRQATNSTGNTTYDNSGARPVRNAQPQVYQPQPQVQSAPPASNSGGSSSSGGGGGGSSSSGGSRPVRP
jgi:hypothetical protein